MFYSPIMLAFAFLALLPHALADPIPVMAIPLDGFFLFFPIILATEAPIVWMCLIRRRGYNKTRVIVAFLLVNILTANWVIATTVSLGWGKEWKYTSTPWAVLVLELAIILVEAAAFVVLARVVIIDALFASSLANITSFLIGWVVARLLTPFLVIPFLLAVPCTLVLLFTGISDTKLALKVLALIPLLWFVGSCIYIVLGGFTTVQFGPRVERYSSPKVVLLEKVIECGMIGGCSTVAQALFTPGTVLNLAAWEDAYSSYVKKVCVRKQIPAFGRSVCGHYVTCDEKTNEIRYLLNHRSLLRIGIYCDNGVCGESNALECAVTVVD